MKMVYGKTYKLKKSNAHTCITRAMKSNCVDDLFGNPTKMTKVDCKNSKDKTLKKKSSRTEQQSPLRKVETPTTKLKKKSKPAVQYFSNRQVAVFKCRDIDIRFQVMPNLVIPDNDAVKTRTSRLQNIPTAVRPTNTINPFLVYVLGCQKNSLGKTQAQVMQKAAHNWNNMTAREKSAYRMEPEPSTSTPTTTKKRPSKPPPTPAPSLLKLKQKKSATKPKKNVTIFLN